MGWVSSGQYPAAAAASLLLLLLLNELHGGGRGRGGSHGPDHLDAVLGQRGQLEALAAAHLHLLKLLETPHGELGDKGGREKRSDSQACVQVEASSPGHRSVCETVSK